MNRKGLTVWENAFCELIALGKKGVEAYEEAFGKPALNDRNRRLYTKRASNLAQRADIIARIEEIKGEQKRRDKEKWQQQGDQIANNLYSAISRSFDHIDKDGKPMILDKDVLKGIEVLAKMKGLNAPEEQVLKNGGMADDYTPRGLQAVSDEDLDKIIEQGEVIDVESETERKGSEDGK